MIMVILPLNFFVSRNSIIIIESLNEFQKFLINLWFIKYLNLFKNIDFYDAVKLWALTLD